MLLLQMTSCWLDVDMRSDVLDGRGCQPSNALPRPPALQAKQAHAILIYNQSLEIDHSDNIATQST